MAASVRVIHIALTIFSNNGAFGIRGGDSNFATLDYCNFFGNGAGACMTCSSLGTNSLTDDPAYILPAAFDLRLLSASTLIDAGTDLLIDVNGPPAGDYNGAAPDMGAWESP